MITPAALRQALVLGIYGLSLTLLFFTFQAPDVALHRQPCAPAHGSGSPAIVAVALLLFAFAGPGLLAVLLIGLHGLPSFGPYHGVYGLLALGLFGRSLRESLPASIAVPRAAACARCAICIRARSATTSPGGARGRV